MTLIKVKERGRETVNLGRRNLIINGAMQIDQRATTHTFQNGTGGYNTVDRWIISEAGTDSFVFEVSQSTDAPDDFAHSFKVDCTTADASLSADVQISFEQKIESRDLQRLNYGTSSAKTMKFSFYVKSNKTGTYVCWFFQDDASRSIGRTYTINSANTWERKTITIPGDTGGTINNNNSSGFRTRFMLGAGSTYTSGTLQTDWGTITGTQANRYVGQVNLADNTANEWYVTGVQLEVGDTVSEFEHRTFGEELALCQRYFHKTGDIGTDQEWFPGVATYAAYGHQSTSTIDGNNDRAAPEVTYPCAMRTRPTIVYYPARSAVSNTAGSITVYNANTLVTTSSKPSGGGQCLVNYFAGTNNDSNMYTYHYTADAEL